MGKMFFDKSGSNSPSTAAPLTDDERSAIYPDENDLTLVDASSQATPTPMSNYAENSVVLAGLPAMIAARDSRIDVVALPSNTTTLGNNYEDGSSASSSSTGFSTKSAFITRGQLRLCRSVDAHGYPSPADSTTSSTTACSTSLSRFATPGLSCVSHNEPRYQCEKCGTYLFSEQEAADHAADAGFGHGWILVLNPEKGDHLLRWDVCCGSTPATSSEEGQGALQDQLETSHQQQDQGSTTSSVSTSDDAQDAGDAGSGRRSKKRKNKKDRASAAAASGTSGSSSSSSKPLLGLPEHHGVCVGERDFLGDAMVAHFERGRGVVAEDLASFAYGGTTGKRRVYLWPHKQRLSKSRTTERCVHMVGKKGFHGIYNNCEHFASWAVIGEKKSRQLWALGGTATGVSAIWHLGGYLAGGALGFAVAHGVFVICKWSGIVYLGSDAAEHHWDSLTRVASLKPGDAPGTCCMCGRQAPKRRNIICDVEEVEQAGNQSGGSGGISMRLKIADRKLQDLTSAQTTASDVHDINSDEQQLQVVSSSTKDGRRGVALLCREIPDDNGSSQNKSHEKSDSVIEPFINCPHGACHGCLKKYVFENRGPLICPHPDCWEPLPPDLFCVLADGGKVE
ncbi:unnamed protein product [Amoebophrya sp. A25]|nr:unnamed protein product [Amoebophrya sp. A25]|eukprot:GSA25T00011117001.1